MFSDRENKDGFIVSPIYHFTIMVSLSLLIKSHSQEQVKINELEKEKAIFEGRDRVREMRLKKAKLSHTYGILFEVWGEVISDVSENNMRVLELIVIP